LPGSGRNSILLKIFPTFAELSNSGTKTLRTTMWRAEYYIPSKGWLSVIGMLLQPDQNFRKFTSKLLLASFLAVATAALACAAVPSPQLADHILIVKSKRTMTLMHGAKVLKSYSVALGTVPVGPKERQGDHKTPEGNYVISAKNSHSQFHFALRISYPSAEDRARARKLGVSPGGDIMIHGLASSFAFLGALHRKTDWTDGCIAVTNPEIEEIWSLVPVGTTVEIRP
jgi:murein L,D-transpeptidase YafK